MKTRWWQFGGWFNVDQVDDQKRGKIQFRRIAGDGLKLPLILVVVYFISMPFWPLAVPPVPQEWLERYPIVEFEPRGDGQAERAWQKMYPWRHDHVGEPPELADAPLYQLAEKLEAGRVREYGLDWDTPIMRKMLVEVQDAFLAFATLCAIEDPPEADDADLLPTLSALRPLLLLSGVLSGVHALDRNPSDALEAMGGSFDISAYMTRSDRLIEWLVGNIVLEKELRAVVSMYAYGVIDSQAASVVETMLADWQRSRGSGMRAMSGEVRFSEASLDYYFGRSELSDQWNEHFDSFASSEIPKYARRLRRWGWLHGNSYRSVSQALGNLWDREMVRADIWTDSSVRDPEAMSAELDIPNRIWFRQGGAFALFPENYFFIDFYRRLYQADAKQIIGHAVAALGAYRNEHGHLPESLADAYVAAGLQPGLQTTYVEQVPIYQRWAGGESNPDAYVVALTIRGDGGRCAREGGVSWLLVHNPAFEEDPAYRLWQWYNMDPNSEIGLDPDIHELELVEAMAGPSSPGPRVLQVPVDIMSMNAETFAAANAALLDAAWIERPIPPRLWVSY